MWELVSDSGTQIGHPGEQIVTFLSAVVRRSNGKRPIELHRADSVDLEGAQKIVPIDPVAPREAL